MATFFKFNAFVENLAEGVHNLAANTLKVYLTNATPDAAADSIKTDLAEISAGNGYTVGGVTMTVSSSSQTSGTYRLVLADNSITASGGTIPSFRYAVLYNDSTTSPLDALIGAWDYGSSISLADGESLSIDCDGTTGVLSIA